MKYEYLQLVIPAKEPNSIYAFLGEFDGKAIICATHYDETLTNRMNTILLVPFEEIEIAEDYGIAETNEMQASFPTDVFIGSMISDFIGNLYRVLAIQPIFFPRQNECRLLVQDSEHRTSVISWAYMEFSVDVNNEFYQQNLNLDKYFKSTSTETYEEKTISSELMAPTDFSFDLNTVVCQIYFKDSGTEKYSTYAPSMDGIPIGSKVLAICEFCYESLYGGMNEIRIHINKEHEKCTLKETSEKIECDSAILDTPSGRFTIQNNEHDFLGLNSGKEVKISIHRLFSKNNEGLVQYIDIYLNNIKKEQYLIQDIPEFESKSREI